MERKSGFVVVLYRHGAGYIGCVHSIFDWGFDGRDSDIFDPTADTACREI